MSEHDERYVGTPYDDVFRTVLNDCPALILPVLNEIFHTEYTGEEKIVFKQNEHFLNQQGGKEEKRITDSAFQVITAKQMGISATPKEYHVECQSTEDSGMLVRFFEYDSQIAIDGSTMEGVKKVMGGKVLEYEAKTILKTGIEQGLEQGALRKLIQLICRKRKRGTSTILIAEDLEEEIQTVEEICDIAETFAPDYDFEMVWQEYLRLHN